MHSVKRSERNPYKNGFISAIVHFHFTIVPHGLTRLVTWCCSLRSTYLHFLFVLTFSIYTRICFDVDLDTHCNVQLVQRLVCNTIIDFIAAHCHLTLASALHINTSVCVYKCWWTAKHVPVQSIIARIHVQLHTHLRCALCMCICVCMSELHSLTLNWGWRL